MAPKAGMPMTPALAPSHEGIRATSRTLPHSPAAARMQVRAYPQRDASTALVSPSGTAAICPAPMVMPMRSGGTCSC